MIFFAVNNFMLNLSQNKINNLNPKRDYETNL